MLSKIICKMYYGKPVAWMDKIIPNYNTVKNYDFVIFTDMPMKSKGNVRVVNSDMEWFSNYVSKKHGINYNLRYTGDTYPISKHLYDLWPTQGVLFEEYHKGYDFWGHGCMDVIYGDVDKWLTDEYLNDCDIFGNDPDAICGPFSLYRNTDKVNHLFEEIPNWRTRLEGPLLDEAMDEFHMTNVVRKARDEGRIRFKSAFWQGPGSMMIHFNHTKTWPTD